LACRHDNRQSHAGGSQFFDQLNSGKLGQGVLGDQKILKALNNLM
jgi:hypothetical protein